MIRRPLILTVSTLTMWALIVVGAPQSSTNASKKESKTSQAPARMNYAPDVCQAGSDLLKGKLPFEIDAKNVTVEYNYKPITAQLFVASDGHFFLQLPEIGGTGALKISLARDIPDILLDLQKDLHACSVGQPATPPERRQTRGSEPSGRYGETARSVAAQREDARILMDAPTEGADSVSATLPLSPTAAIELCREKSGSLPDCGESLGVATAQSVKDGQVEIPLRRGVDLKKGDAIFVRSGLMRSVLVTVKEKTANPVTKLEDNLHQGQTVIKGFTQDVTATSVKLFIEGVKDSIGSTDDTFKGTDGAFAITLAAGNSLTRNDKVIAKTDKGDSSDPVTVGPAVPISPAPAASSDSGTVSLDPLNSAEGEVHATAAPGANVNLVRGGIVADSKKAGADGNALFEIPATNPLHPDETVTVCTGDPASVETGDCASNKVENVFRDGEQFRAVVGFAQSGAANANNTNKFFLDFYVSRPLTAAFGEDHQEPRLRWWGNVRIGSKPIDSVGFSALPAQAKALKVNELAQAAEFLSGLDFRLNHLGEPMLGQSEDSNQRFALSFIAGLGATGSLTNTTSAASGFTLPAAGSQSLAALTSFYPSLKNITGNFAVKSPEERFGMEWWTGFRVTTRYFDKYKSPLRTPPAMVLFAVGQSEAVTPGVLRGMVGRFETFYPMLTHSSNPVFSSLYLFGTAQLRFGGARFPALSLAPTDPTTTPVAGLPTVFDRVTRDQYSIGVGLDLVNVLSRAKITFH